MEITRKDDIKMEAESRTFKSLRNGASALALYVANALVLFFSRKVFLDKLGAEVLGLNTLAASLLQLLNLAELGIGFAIAVTLYKPLAENDRKTIGEIVSLQGWFYRRVALAIIAAAGVLMLFFPRIFAKADLPLWYAYSSFGVMLFGSLVGYFLNYKQIVLSANQQQYQITRTYSSAILLKVVFQMAAVSVFSDKAFLWWLSLEFAFAVLGCLLLNWQIRKTCPWLETRVSDGATLQKKYPDILTKIKQLFIHKISTIVLFQTTSPIIYAIGSLTLVTDYMNYALLTTYLLSLIDAAFDGMGASIGNLVAEGNPQRIQRVFKELFSVRFLIISTAAFCYFKLATPLVSLWLKEGHALDWEVTLMITLMFFIRGTRTVVDAFINAYGLFFDIWAPLTEAILNVGLSILLGHFLGLPGVLGGVLLSQILIICLWKPILLFRHGFKRPVVQYAGIYGKHLGLLAVAVLLANLILGLLPFAPAAGLWQFACTGVVAATTFALAMGGLQLATEQGTRDFADRLWNQIIHKHP